MMRKLGMLVLVTMGAAGCRESATGPVREIPASVRVSVPAVRLESLGDTVQLAAEVYDANGRILPGYGIRWRVEQAGIVDTAGASGRFRSVENGEVRVWAELATAGGGITREDGYRADVAGAFVAVTVAQRPVSVGLEAAEATLWARGGRLQVAPSIRDARGALVTAALPRVVWTTSDPLIATVDSTGTVRAVADGVVTLTSTLEGVTPAVTGQLRLRVATAVDPRFCVTAENGEQAACAEAHITIAEPAR